MTGHSAQHAGPLIAVQGLFVIPVRRPTGVPDRCLKEKAFVTACITLGTPTSVQVTLNITPSFGPPTA